MMLQLSSSGALQYADANPVEEARLAWVLAGNLMARRCGQWEDNLVISNERPSLATGEGPPEVERERQRQELERYLQRMHPSDGNDALGQYQPSVGPLTIRFRLGARSTDQGNPDTKSDSVGIQQDIDVGAEEEPAQEQEEEQDFHWTPSWKQRVRRWETRAATLH